MIQTLADIIVLTVQAWTDRFVAIFTETLWPFLQGKIVEAATGAEAGASAASQIIDCIGEDRAGQNSTLVIVGGGLFIAFVLFRACDADSVDGFLEYLFGDQSAGTHRGIVPQLFVIALLNLVVALYQPIQELLNIALLHTTTNAVENCMTGLFNPLGILILTVVVMHGFASEGESAMWFAPAAVLFPFVFTSAAHTRAQWFVLVVESIVGALIARYAAENWRYVHKGYLVFSIWYLLSQVIWVMCYIDGVTTISDLLDFVLSLDTWHDYGLEILMDLRAEFIATFVIFLFWLLLERLLVGSARDIHAALQRLGERA